MATNCHTGREDNFIYYGFYCIEFTNSEGVAKDFQIPLRTTTNCRNCVQLRNID